MEITEYTMDDLKVKIKNFTNNINRDWFNLYVSGHLHNIENDHLEKNRLQELAVEVVLLYSFYINQLKKEKKPISDILRSSYYDINYIEGRKILDRARTYYNDYEDNKSLLQKILDILPKNRPDEEKRGLNGFVFDLKTTFITEISDIEKSKEYLFEALNKISKDHSKVDTNLG